MHPVTDPNGRIPRSPTPPHPVPRTASEFASYFLRHPISEANNLDMRSYHDEFIGKQSRRDTYRHSALLEHAKHTRDGSPYLISIPMQARALMLRRVQILLGDQFTFYLTSA